MLAWANYNGFHVASVISDPPSPQGLMETEAERWKPSPPTWSHPTRNKVCVRDKEAAVTVWRWRGAEHCALANHQGQNIGLRVITTRVLWWGQRWSLCHCLERLGKLISGNNRMLMSFNVLCVHLWQHLRVKKIKFSKKIFICATERPQLRRESYFQILRGNSLSLSRAVNTRTSKNTIWAFVWSECCIVVKSREQTVLWQNLSQSDDLTPQGT